MPASKRRFEPSVADQLLAQPYRFEFFQAVRIIELWLRQLGMGKGKTLFDYLRFKNRLSMDFPPSEIEAIEVVADLPVESAEALVAALLGQQLTHICIKPAVIGLLGSQGAMPYHYTEYIAAYERRTGDEGTRDFMDLCSNGSLMLFYRAWKKHRLDCMEDAEGNDALLPLLLSIAGFQARDPLGEAIQAAPHEPTPETIAFYAAQCRGRAVTTSLIAGVLSDYFQLPFSVQPLLGYWEQLPEQDLAILGKQHCKLGEFHLGRRVYRGDNRVGISVGPLDAQTWEQFLPRSLGAQALNKILGIFCGVGMSFEIRPILRASDVTGFVLNGSARLGYHTHMLKKGAQKDRNDVRYLLRP